MGDVIDGGFGKGGDGDGELSPREALESALELDLKEVLVLGIRKDGHPIIRANGDMTEYEAVWLCEWAKHIVLKMADEEAAEGE